jgi:hypothetical protein
MSTFTITFPKIVTARDYHAFDDIRWALNQVVSAKIRVKELGFKYKYYAVLYVDTVPTNDEIDNLLKEHEITLAQLAEDT